MLKISQDQKEQIKHKKFIKTVLMISSGGMNINIVEIKEDKDVGRLTLFKYCDYIQLLQPQCSYSWVEEIFRHGEYMNKLYIILRSQGSVYLTCQG